MNRVLILGAGLVAGPMVRYLLDLDEFQVTVASRTLAKAEALIAGHPRGRALAVDVADDDALDGRVREADLVVSLLPYTHHLRVAERCLKHRKHLVTTSYVKPAMQALDADAREAGIILLNEIGLDPGIDHMSAMRVIDSIKRQGGRLTTFVSYCGGIPAPADNDNPWGYKFSWSPRGVIMAGKNPAHYVWDGREIDIPGEELFDHHWPVEIPSLGVFEAYPNRDSMPYADVYQIAPDQTMFRGTLRYPGWCSTMKKIAELGLLDDRVRDDLAGLTFAQLTARLLGVADGTELESTLVRRLGLPAGSPVVSNLAWLGFLSNELLPAGVTTLMDVLADRMVALMQYRPGERDMIVLYDVFYAEYSDRTERTSSTLIAYGIPHGDSAMARTVSLPAAIAARLILTGEITATGVHIPVISEIYEPVLDELDSLGIRCVEQTREI